MLSWSIDDGSWQPSQGDRAHDILIGWERYYGTHWVPEAVWLRIKISGL